MKLVPSILRLSVENLDAGMVQMLEIWSDSDSVPTKETDSDEVMVHWKGAEMEF